MIMFQTVTRLKVLQQKSKTHLTVHTNEKGKTDKMKLQTEAAQELLFFLAIGCRLACARLWS
jgi:energy-converting hydrogenase Eha subunit H